jgi:hypothetical protein
MNPLEQGFPALTVWGHNFPYLPARGPPVYVKEENVLRIRIDFFKMLIVYYCKSIHI